MGTGLEQYRQMKNLEIEQLTAIGNSADRIRTDRLHNATDLSRGG